MRRARATQVGLVAALSWAAVAIVGARQAPQPGISGEWHGTLRAGGAALRLQLHVTPVAGKLTATLDSLDQGITGLKCSRVLLSGREFRFTVAAVHGSYQGTLSRTATGGFTAFAEFLPRARMAVVVLYNREDLGGPQTPFADLVAANVTALLRGSPAPRLEP